MNDKEIDELFRRDSSHPVDPAVLSRVSTSMTATLTPVQPLPPVWMLALGIMLIATFFAVGYASLLGFYGLQSLRFEAIVSIFTALGISTWFSALASVAAMSPGGGPRWKNPTVTEPLMRSPLKLMLTILVVWLAVDAIFFRNYDPGSFVRQGYPCLRAGLITAVPTGIGSWLMLRRGLAINPLSAGGAAGTLAGLAGLVMLELHCPNFRAPHVMTWHTAVVPVSALVGALLARVAVR